MSDSDAVPSVGAVLQDASIDTSEAADGIEVRVEPSSSLIGRVEEIDDDSQQHEGNEDDGSVPNTKKQPSPPSNILSGMLFWPVGKRL